MTVYELSREQLDELKEHYAVEIADENPNFFNEHDGYEITDQDVIEHYEGYDFGNDDFWCTAGMNDEDVKEAPINEFIEYLEREEDDEIFLGALKNYKVSDLLRRVIRYMADMTIKGDQYDFKYALADVLDMPEEKIEKHFDIYALFYNLDTNKEYYI